MVGNGMESDNRIEFSSTRYQAKGSKRCENQKDGCLRKASVFYASSLSFGSGMRMMNVLPGNVASS